MTVSFITLSHVRPSTTKWGISRTQWFCVNGKLRKNIQNRVLLRNSKKIMLFSIFSGIHYRFLSFICVLHRFYFWLYVSLMQINIKMVKRAIFRHIVHSANCNLASNHDRNILLSPFWSQCSPLSHCVKTSICLIWWWGVTRIIISTSSCCYCYHIPTMKEWLHCKIANLVHSFIDIQSLDVSRRMYIISFTGSFVHTCL